MDEMLFYDRARENVAKFFEREFPTFPPLILSHLLNRFIELLNYKEEGNFIRPKLVLTDNIEAIVKTIPNAHSIMIFEDDDASMFNLRLKSLLAVTNSDWCVFVDIKQKISYGLIMSFSSIKEKGFLSALESNLSLRERRAKLHCIVMRPLNFFTMQLHSISGDNLIINLALDKTMYSQVSSETEELVDATFSKLRTTPRKLQDMKNMCLNIFQRVMNDVSGAICVVVDKEYKDTGLFEDGIWLKEPISFSKLFTQSKSFNETKLQNYADLFVKMISYDGITIIDNMGRILAYNVFVEPSNKKVGYIVGGARKRAAYYILNSKRKGIVGVYFQSHEGEVFYKEIGTNKKAKSKQKLTPKREAPHIIEYTPTKVEDENFEQLVLDMNRFENKSN